MKKVAIIQRVLPHYRVAFFHGLREALVQEGIELELFYGQEYPGTVPKTVDLNVDWAHRLENHYSTLLGVELVWQPCLKPLRDADLVIMEQANRLLINYLLLFSRWINKRPKLAYWGHGRNMQADASRNWRESFKRLLTNSVDWWFAYTAMSAKTVISGGFPAEKITLVQNTIDATALNRAADALSAARLDGLRAELGIEASDKVGVFCGGMYADKKLDFLLEACEAIHARVPDFHVVLIGNGPEQGKVEAAAARWSWVHYVGPVYGPDRVTYFKLGSALLMPGLVGLAIVDSFVTETPIFTTDLPLHSPEVAYLQDGINGMMTDFSVKAYADAVAAYLEDGAAQEKLKRGCAESARLYTLENMVANFAAGIKNCLAMKR